MRNPSANTQSHPRGALGSKVQHILFTIFLLLRYRHAPALIEYNTALGILQLSRRCKNRIPNVKKGYRILGLMRNGWKSLYFILA